MTPDSASPKPPADSDSDANATAFQPKEARISAPSSTPAASAFPPVSGAPGLSDLEVSGNPTILVHSNRPGGSDLNRYVLKKFHARGGMGEVWLSEDGRLGREVALKRLSGGSKHAKERFLAEAQITSQLEHPGIVPVHDMGVDDAGQPFYIMKFLRGRSLKAVIAEYHAALAKGDKQAGVMRLRLLEIFLNLAHAVAYAHSRGVVHRDLKPDNVMVGEFGETLVLDWGLAKVRGQPDTPGGGSGIHTSGTNVTETQAGSIIGSPLYMPPEMADGRIPETDERTDVYLLGATLYEIISGRPPREGRSRDEILEMARTAPPPSPRKLRSDIPRSLEAICLKALAQRKEDRYASTMDMAQDIQSFLAGEPVSARRENVLEKAWRWGKRHRVALARTAAIVIVATGGVWTYQLMRREQARVQIEQFDTLAGDARYYAGNTEEGAEHAPSYDPVNARLKAAAAMKIAEPWGDSLGSLALQDQAPRLRGEAYELLLLMAEDAIAHGSQPFADQDAGAMLDRAQRLNPSVSRGYYRLRSQYLRQHNDLTGSAEAQRRADDPGMSSAAFDFFLLGEEARQRIGSEALVNATLQNVPDFADAIADYRKALQIDPANYWSYFQMGRCYMNAGKWLEAVEAYTTCVALKPEAPWAFSARGIAWALMHRFDDAHHDLESALQRDPNFRPARFNRGYSFFLEGKRDEALADFAAVLEPPENRRIVEAAYYRARLLTASHDYAKALDDLNDVIKNRPGFYPAYKLRAFVHLVSNQAQEGQEDLATLAKLIGAGPGDLASPILAQRGRLFRRIAADLGPSAAARKATELASDDLEQAVKLNLRSAGAWADLGAVREMLGQNEPAIAAYSQSLQLDPANSQIQINRGWLLQRLSRYDKAKADFQDVVARSPDNSEAHTGLGYVDALENSYDPAYEEAGRALVYGAGDYLILHNVACIYAEMSKTQIQRARELQDAAIDTLRRAVELSRRGNIGPDEIDQIKHEPAFSPSLQARAEFQQLLKR